MVNHGGLIFPEKVAVCLLFPFMEPWELGLLARSFPVFLQCKINVTLLFNLHASNVLCFLVNKYAKDSHLAGFVVVVLFVFKQGPALYTDRSSIANI